MAIDQVLSIVCLSQLYILLIAALYFGLSRLRLSPSRAIILASLIFGLMTGLLAVWAWDRSDAAIYVNLYAVYAGDQLYSALADAFGQANPSQAHEAVPWPLRVPQIYFLSASLLSLLFGLLAAAVVSACQRRNDF